MQVAGRKRHVKSSGTPPGLRGGWGIMCVYHACGKRLFSWPLPECPEFLDNFRIFSMMLEDSGGFSKILEDSRWISSILKDPREFWKILEDSRGFSMIHEDSREFSKILKDPSPAPAPAQPSPCPGQGSGLWDL